MLEIQIIKTTDGKREGEMHTVSQIDYNTVLAYGLKATSISWNKDVCLVQSSNYTVKLKKIGE